MIFDTEMCVLIPLLTLAIVQTINKIAENSDKPFVNTIPDSMYLIPLTQTPHNTTVYFAATDAHET